MPGLRGLKVTPDVKESILECLRAGGGVLTAAEKVGISRATIYKHFHSDEAFKKAADQARNRADENVVSALYTAAMGGNITAMIFWLKNRQRNDWRDRHDFQVEHKQDGVYVAQFADETGIEPAAADLPLTTAARLPN